MKQASAAGDTDEVVNEEAENGEGATKFNNYAAPTRAATTTLAARHGTESHAWPEEITSSATIVDPTESLTAAATPTCGPRQVTVLNDDYTNPECVDVNRPTEDLDSGEPTITSTTATPTTIANGETFSATNVAQKVALRRGWMVGAGAVVVGGMML